MVAFPFDRQANEIALGIAFCNPIDAHRRQLAGFHQTLATFLDMAVFGQFLEETFQPNPGPA